MRHRKKREMPATDGGHRRSLMRNQTISLLKHGYIKTTQAKAKALRPHVERLITKAKKSFNGEGMGKIDQRDIRLLTKETGCKKTAHILLMALGPLYFGRPGGYTRIFKVKNRVGDNAPLAIISLVFDDIDYEYGPAFNKAVISKCSNNDLDRALLFDRQNYHFFVEEATADKRLDSRWLYEFDARSVSMQCTISSKTKTAMSVKLRLRISEVKNNDSENQSMRIHRGKTKNQVSVNSSARTTKKHLPIDLWVDTDVEATVNNVSFSQNGLEESFWSRICRSSDNGLRIIWDLGVCNSDVGEVFADVSFNAPPRRAALKIRIAEKRLITHRLLSTPENNFAPKSLTPRAEV